MTSNSFADFESLSDFADNLEAELDKAMAEIDKEASNLEYKYFDDSGDEFSDDELGASESTLFLLSELSKSELHYLKLLEENTNKYIPSVPESVDSSSSIHSLDNPSISAASPLSIFLQINGQPEGAFSDLIQGDYSSFTPTSIPTAPSSSNSKSTPIPKRDDVNTSNALSRWVANNYIGLHDCSNIVSNLFRPSSSSKDSSSVAMTNHILGEVMHVLEIVVRPDVPLHILLACVAKVANIERLRFQEVDHDSGGDTVMYSSSVANAVRATSTYSNRASSKSSHVMTTNHVQLLTKRSLKLTESNRWGSIPPTDKPMQEMATAPFEWDVVDVQVGISKSLKQRVIVCQFLHTNAAATLLLQTLQRHPTSVKQDVTSVELPPLSKGAISICAIKCKPVQHIEHTFQQLFTRYHLSLSCLFRLPTSCFGPNLDESYISLLSELYRTEMWNSLHNASELLEAQVNIARSALDDMKQILEPVYKEHGISQISSLNLVDRSFESKDEMMPYNAKAQRFVNDDVSSDDDENINIRSTHNKDDISIDTQLKKLASDNDLACDSSITLNSSSNGADTVGESISVCLAVVQKLSLLFQSKCDHELTDRLNCRSLLTTETILEIDKRKVALLAYMTKSSQALVSPLSRAFQSSFEGVEIMRVSPLSGKAIAPVSAHASSKEVVTSHVEAPAAASSTSSTATSSSWSSWLFGSRTNNTTITSTTAVTSMKQSVDASVAVTSTSKESPKASVSIKIQPRSTGDTGGDPTDAELIDFTDWSDAAETASSVGVNRTNRPNVQVQDIKHDILPSARTTHESPTLTEVKSSSSHRTDAQPSSGFTDLTSLIDAAEGEGEGSTRHARMDSFDSDEEQQRVSLYPPISTEVVLYYCAGFTSNGMPGVFYLTPHYIGITASILGLGSRKQLCFLWDLFEVQINKTLITSPGTTTALSHVPQLANAHLPCFCTFLFSYQAGGGGVLRGGSYESVEDVSNYPTVVKSLMVKQQTENSSSVFHSSIVRREISFTPALETCERIRDVTVLARDMLYSQSVER